MNNFLIPLGVSTCIVIYALFTIILKLGRQRRLCKEASKFPGPPTLPIIGNAHLFIGSREEVYNRFLRMGRLYPTPYRIWIGNYLIFVINTPEQLKAILHSTKIMDKGDLYGFVQPWLGTGLLTSSGATWQLHRKLMQPTFSSTILKSFVEIFSAQSEIMAKEMKRHLDGPEFDVYKYTSQFTLRTICGTTMGVNLGVEANSDGRYAKAITNVIASVCKRVLSPWLHPNFIFNNTQIGKEQRKDIEFLHDFTANVIQTKKMELLEKNHQAKPHLSKVLLDHLLEVSRNGNTLSDEALREEVDTIMVAGSDTTAVTISFAMLMLASHPDIQEKVYQEQCEIHKDDDNEERNITSKDLSRMVYLERVIKETMRLFPVSPTLVRSVKEDFVVAIHYTTIVHVIGEHTLPAGSLVFLSLMELHRNGDIWSDPLKFNPDRFLPEEVGKRDSHAFLPFSGGPRNCIGSKYAMMSMKSLFAIVIRRYILKKDDITQPKDVRLKWEFLLRSVDPITLRIERRTRKFASV